MCGDVIHNPRHLVLKHVVQITKMGNLNECVLDILHGQVVLIDMHNSQNNDITINLIAKKDLKVGHVLFQKNI